jgi:hypothetical protein
MESLLDSLEPTLRQFMTTDEELQIHRQFQGRQWKPNRQVLWTGIDRAIGQKWTNAHNMQTLTTAMGPLMDPSDASCVRKRKSKYAWSKYIKGASALFACYIAGNNRVVVLSPPPPDRFHPSGLTNYQAIEEPILKRAIVCGALLQIEMVHPAVKGAEDFYYQVWPIDDTATWIAMFGMTSVPRPRWRLVTTDHRQMAFQRAIEAAARHSAREEADSSTEEAGSPSEEAACSIEEIDTFTEQNRSGVSVRALCWHGEVWKKPRLNLLAIS